MPSLEEDTRHFERNGEARERALIQLRGPLRAAIAEVLLDGDESDIADLRDMLKEAMRARARRQERKDKGITEIFMGVLRWLLALALGAAGAWFSIFHQNGSK